MVVRGLFLQLVELVIGVLFLSLVLLHLAEDGIFLVVLEW